MTLREKHQRGTSAARAVSSLSQGQRAVWLRQQLAPGSPMHITARALRCRGPLDRHALARAAQTLVERHTTLRATFTMQDDEPVQEVRSGRALSLAYEDAATWTDAELRERLVAAAFGSLDLGQGPLFRLVLFGRGAEEHVLLLVMHDLVADVQSLAVLVSELTALYAAARASGPPPFTGPAPSYAAYVAWQERRLTGSTGEQLRTYWQRQIAGAPPVLALPMAGPRPAMPRYRGAVWTGSLGAAQSAALDDLARRAGVSRFTLLLTAFAVLLSRYTGQEDVVIGTTPAQPDQDPFGAMVGCRSDLLPLRADLTGAPSFREALRRVDARVRGAQAHQEYPLVLLVEQLAQARVPGYAPLVQIGFQLYQAEARELGDLTALLLGVAGPPLPWADLTLEPLALERPATPLDLTLSMGSVAGDLVASFAYNAEVFDAETIARMGGHLQTVLLGIVADPDRTIATLPFLPAAEREQLLTIWGRGPAVQDVGGRLGHELVQAQAAHTPDAVAVTYGDLRLTYVELDRRANQLAHHLQSLGIGPDAVVGLLLERSLDLPIALLAIFKAGGAYLSLDPGLPREQLTLILEDARAPLVLTHRHLRDGARGFAGQVLELDTDAHVAAVGNQCTTPPPCAATSASLVAVGYTSGSTGKPKGVEVTHAAWLRAFVALKQWDQWRIATGSRILLYYNLSECFLAWTAGATLVVPPDAARRDFEDLLRRIVDEAITHLTFPSSALPSLAEAAERTAIVPRSLRRIAVSGAQLRVTPPMVRLFEQLPYCALLSIYSASEVGMVACYALTGPPAHWPERPPLGRPYPGVQIYVLDDQLQPVPIGVPGQLYACAGGMARGYRHRLDLTAERFMRNPFGTAPDGQLYQTGDVVRFLPDGMLEFVGRADDQVKYRGYRVEPGEVETVLRTHPTVAEAVVMARTDGPGGHRLVAYVVAAAGQRPLGRELRAFLASRLPEYMVPATYMLMEALPRLYNNKIDRRALPAPGPARPDLETPYVAPHTPTEAALARIMAALLGLERVGMHDSFFDLGGHSLLAVRLFRRIEQQFGRKLPLGTLYEDGTVARLARRLDAAGDALERSLVVTVQRGSDRPPLFCVHPVNGITLYYRDFARYLGPDQPVYAIEPWLTPDGRHYARSRLEDLAARYVREIRQVQPEGPYHLGGLSSGGVIAFEIAQQLAAQGQEVALLALFDTFCPVGTMPSVRTALASWPERAWLHTRIMLHLRLPDQYLYARARLQAVRRRLDRRYRDGPAPGAASMGAVGITDPRLEPYVPRTYPGRAVLFLAGQQDIGGVRQADDPRVRWRRFTRDGVVIHRVLGTHFSVLQEPAIARHVARLVRTHIASGG